MKRVKRIPSYAGLARFIAELSDPVAHLARCQVEDIPSPYYHSPTCPIYEWQHLFCNRIRVIYFETAHRQFDVFEVPKELLTFGTEQEPVDWHLRYGGQKVGAS